jgi:hypothetical protein
MSRLGRLTETQLVREVGLEERECLYRDGIEEPVIESWLGEEA